jgi:hypothetical protein
MQASLKAAPSDARAQIKAQIDTAHEQLLTLEQPLPEDAQEKPAGLY